MKTIVVGSINRGAGKTSLIVGMSKALGKKIGYMKPFGDRLLYKKKRLWDHDSAVVTELLTLGESPENMSIGFDHSKLRYMQDENGLAQKVSKMAAEIGKGTDYLFVEGPATFSYGASVGLDLLSVASNLGGKLVLVVSGTDDSILDKILFMKKRIDLGGVNLGGVNLGGVIVNKVADEEDFKNTYQPVIEQMGVKVLGVIPDVAELKYFTVSLLSTALFAKVIAGEGGMSRQVRKVYVGAMTGDMVLKEHYFKAETKKLVITSGDRSDMILASLETGSSAIILTNNILPDPKIISRAADMNVPLLLVSTDTFQVAKQIDDLEPLLTKDDPEKAELLKKLVEKYVDIKSL